MPDELLNYSPDNWAHKALILMDEANALVNWGAVSHPNTDKYKTAAKAFWDVCHLLAQERTRLHNGGVQAPCAASCARSPGTKC